MAGAEITATNAVQEVTLVANRAMARLTESEELLHNRGYHTYSTVVANMRLKVEQALIDAIDELIPED